MIDAERPGARLRPHCFRCRQLHVGASCAGPAEFSVKWIGSAGRRKQNDRRRFGIDRFTKLEQREVVDAPTLEIHRTVYLSPTSLIALTSSSDNFSLTRVNIGLNLCVRSEISVGVELDEKMDTTLGAYSAGRIGSNGQAVNSSGLIVTGTVTDLNAFAECDGTDGRMLIRVGLNMQFRNDGGRPLIVFKRDSWSNTFARRLGNTNIIFLRGIPLKSDGQTVFK